MYARSHSNKMTSNECGLAAQPLRLNIARDCPPSILEYWKGLPPAEGLLLLPHKRDETLLLLDLRAQERQVRLSQGQSHEELCRAQAAYACQATVRTPRLPREMSVRSARDHRVLVLGRGEFACVPDAGTQALEHNSSLRTTVLALHLLSQHLEALLLLAPCRLASRSVHHRRHQDCGAQQRELSHGAAGPACGGCNRESIRNRTDVLASFFVNKVKI